MLTVALAIGLASAAPSEASIVTTEEHDVGVVTLAEGLEHPWALAFTPGGDILISERPGRLRLYRDGELLPEPIPGTPEVAAVGQGGLLDLALHPDFAENRWLYMSYAKPGERGATTAVARARFDGERLSDLEDIFVADAWGSGGRHFGSRLVFDREGYLYITIGDRGTMERAQDTSDHAGTTIRLHDDGQIPDDNPFLDDDTVRDEIFTFGNRNAQGMSLHPQTGAVWQNEHGPRGGDEVNLISAGLNYGWPVITHGIDYSGAPIGVGGAKEGMEQPLVDWTPSIAPSGMAFYTGEAFPGWQGDLFNGALAQRHLRRVVFDGTKPVHQERLLDDFGLRIRDVRDGPDGFLYLLVDSSDAPLLRLEPAE